MREKWNDFKMTPEQKAAYIMANAVSLYAEIEAMKAANKERELNGNSIAYDEVAFYNLMDNPKYMFLKEPKLSEFMNGPY